MESYRRAIILDSQQRVVDAFRDGTRIGDVPKIIRDTALLDPEFGTEINNYYNYVEQSARDLGITPAQFQQLQDTPEGVERKTELQEMTDLEAKEEITEQVVSRQQKAQVSIMRGDKVRKAQSELSSYGKDYHTELTQPQNRRVLVTGGRNDLTHYHSNQLYQKYAEGHNLDHTASLTEEEQEDYALAEEQVMTEQVEQPTEEQPTAEAEED